MTTKKQFLRRCSECQNATVIVNKGDEKAACPVCDTNHTVEWIPKIHAIANTANEENTPEQSNKCTEHKKRRLTLVSPIDRRRRRGR